MNFIEIYDNALTSTECKNLISYFEKSPKGRGKLGYEGEEIIDLDKKKCFELYNCDFSDPYLPSLIIKPSLINCVSKYNKKYKSLEYASSWCVYDKYTFKRYEREDDGFKIWHTEQCKGNADRIFVWQYYLNNAKSGTEFMNYRNVNAKEGRCVVWPAGWTHMHRSLPNKGLKYVISGWVSFT